MKAIVIKGGEQVAKINDSPYSFDMDGDDPAVQRTLESLSDMTDWNTGPNSDEEPSSPFEQVVDADDATKFSKAVGSLRARGYRVKTGRMVGAAQLVDQQSMSYLNGLLDQLTDDDTPERTRNLWKAFLNRVVLRKISMAAAWEPALHPRDPETGQFVERPFDVPDSIRGMDTPDLVRELAAEDDEFSDKVEGLQIDMDEDLQSVVDEVSESDNAAVQNRFALDYATKGEPVDLRDVDEGDEVVAEYEETRRNRAIAGTVTATGENVGDAYVTVERPDGDTKTFNERDPPDMWRAAGPVSGEPDIDLSGDREQREQALREFLNSHVVTSDIQTPSVNNDGISDDKADTVLDNLAEWYSRADPDMARRWAGGFRGLQLNGGAKARPTGANGTLGFRLNVGEQGSVQEHEAAHGLGYVYGMESTPYPGGDDGTKQSGVPDFDWNGEDVAEKYAFTAQNNDFLVEQGTTPGLDDWKPRVDSEFTNLTGDDFNEIPENEQGFSPELHEDLTEGAMVRFAEPLDREQRRGLDDKGPQNYTVTNVERDGDREFSDKVATLRGHDGQEFRLRVQADGTVDAENRDRIGFMPDIQGKRPETPDNWGVQKRNPDDVLGEGAADVSTNEAMRRFFTKVNEAWYRQAAAKRAGNENSALQLSIGSGGYSVHNAHETLARLEENVSQPDDRNSRSATAHALVNYHPDLLEQYRQVRDLPPEFKAVLNDELERAGADFRFNEDST